MTDRTITSPGCEVDCEAARLAGQGSKVKLCNRLELWHGAAMSDILDPEQCHEMSEVRAGVDELDRRLVALIARRFQFMAAAARIKSDRATVRDEWRKAEVLDKVATAAASTGVDPKLMARLYEDLVETSIAYELARWDALHDG